jgi:hypothetical protein
MVTCGTLITDPSICGFLINTIFPWVFSFAIIYGLVLATKVFGEPKDKSARGIAGLIGVVAAFLITMSAGATISSFLTAVSGTILMYATVILGIVMLFALVSPDLLSGFGGKDAKGLKALALVIAFILVAGLIVSGFTPGITSIQITQDLVTLIVILLVVAGIVWFVVGGKKE